MQKLIDNTKIVRKWNDDKKKLREATAPMATRLSFWRRLIRSHVKRTRAASAMGRAIYQHRTCTDE